jgi:hypothetical protein
LIVKFQSTLLYIHLNNKKYLACKYFKSLINSNLITIKSIVYVSWNCQYNLESIKEKVWIASAKKKKLGLEKLHSSFEINQQQKLTNQIEKNKGWTQEQMRWTYKLNGKENEQMRWTWNLPSSWFSYPFVGCWFSYSNLRSGILDCVVHFLFNCVEEDDSALVCCGCSSTALGHWCL